eukprot:scaffold2212_cov134-Isochrysis_galbana.AAC.4
MATRGGMWRPGTAGGAGRVQACLATCMPPWKLIHASRRHGLHARARQLVKWEVPIWIDAELVARALGGADGIGHRGDEDGARVHEPLHLRRSTRRAGIVSGQGA